MKEDVRKNLKLIVESIAIILIMYAFLMRIDYVNNQYHSETRTFADIEEGYRCNYYLEYNGDELINVSVVNCTSTAEIF